MCSPQSTSPCLPTTTQISVCSARSAIRVLFATNVGDAVKRRLSIVVTDLGGQVVAHDDHTFSHYVRCTSPTLHVHRPACHSEAALHVPRDILQARHALHNIEANPELAVFALRSDLACSQPFATALHVLRAALQASRPCMSF